MPQELFARLPKESAREYAFRYLLHNIVHLEYKPGEVVSANELAEVLGVSRTPVREAIQDLEKSGIIDVFPQSGSRISYINYDRIHEERFIRLTLEKAVTAVACNALTPESELELEAILTSQQNCLKLDNKNKLLELDNLFHRHLHMLAGKMLTFQCVERLRYHSDRVRRLSLDAMDAAVVVSDHRAILDAMKKRDPEAAQRAMGDHLSRYIEEESTLRKEYPEYFG